MRRLALVMLVLLCWSAPAGAATLTVTSAADSGAGSLREQIAAAAAGDTVTFEAALQGQTITLLSTIAIDRDLTIVGAPAGAARPTLTGNVTLLSVGAGVTATLSFLRIADADAPDAPTVSGRGGDAGASVIASRGSLTIADSVIADSTGGDGGDSSSSGGGGGGGSVVAGRGTLLIERTVITGNAGGAGGQTDSGGGGGGGAVVASVGTLTIRASTLTANVAGNGGPSFYGGGGAGGATVASIGTLVIADSTLDGNTGGNGGRHVSTTCGGGGGAGGGGDGGGGGGCDVGIGTGAGGGGMDAGGGGGGQGRAGGAGLFGAGGDTTTNNTGGGGGGGGGDGADGTAAGVGGDGGGPGGGAGGTPGGGDGGTGGGGGGGTSGQGVGSGGGGDSGGGGSGNGAVGVYGGTVTVRNSTLAGNTRGEGGTSAFGTAGLPGAGAIVVLRGTATVTSSILADTAAGAGDCRGTLTGDANLVETAVGCVTPAGTLSGDPALGALTDNGGPTPTMLPQAGSPALNAGANPDAVRFDQRGAPFVRVSEATPDVGAVEVQPVGVPLTISAGTSGTYGAPLAPLVPVAQGLVDGNALADLPGTLSCTTTAPAAPHVGSYVVTCGGLGGGGKYTVTFVNGSHTVTPAALTIRADDRQLAFRQPLPTFTATPIGLVAGDTLGTLPGTLTCSARGAASRPDAGRYPIGCSGKTSPDYAISYQDGTLTVEPQVQAAGPARARRLTVATRRVLVLGKAGRATQVTCTLDKPGISRCTATLSARVGGRTTVLARATAKARSGAKSVRLTLPLDDRTRALARRPGGLAATLVATATQTGQPAPPAARVPILLLPRAVLSAPSDGMFAPGGKALPANGTAYLRQLRSLVVGARRITCTGHTDDRGSPADNAQLGLARASAVCAFLKGGTRIAVRVRSAGEANPRASNATEAGRARNRYVEIAVAY